MDETVVAAPAAPAPAAAPAPQTAPEVAPQQAAPEAAPSFNPLDIGSVAASFAADRAKMVAATLPDRDPTGKFVSSASQETAPASDAPVADPNPAIGQPDSEPMIEMGEQFGKVPAKDVPAFVEQLVAHRTNEYQTKLAELSQELPTLKQQLAELQQQARAAIEERDQIIAWGQSDPQSLANVLQSLPRVTQGMTSQPAPNAQPQGQFLTEQQVQAKFNEFWQAKQAEQQAQAAQVAAQQAETQRVNGVISQRLNPVIGGLPENLQKWVKEAVGARLYYDQSMVNAPEPVLVQRMVAEAQRLVNEINSLNRTRVEAQKKIAANTAPPVNGGPVPAPRVDRSGFNPLDFNSVLQDFRAERARLQGM